MFYWENIIETPASYYDVDKFIFLGGGLCSPFSMTLGELYGLAEFLKGLESPFTFRLPPKSSIAPTSSGLAASPIDNPEVPLQENPILMMPVNSRPPTPIVTTPKPSQPMTATNSCPATPANPSQSTTPIASHPSTPKPSQPTTPVNSPPATPANPSQPTTPIATHSPTPVGESGEVGLP